jgi:hypothetical protein
LGGWSVTRLRSAAHGTLNVPGLSLGVGPKGGLGDHGDAVSRQLILTKVSLVERRPENYEVSDEFIKSFCGQLVLNELKTIYLCITTIDACRLNFFDEKLSNDRQLFFCFDFKIKFVPHKYNITC